MSIECKLVDFVVNEYFDSFQIQMFGIDEKRNTYSILVKNYLPFVYIRLSSIWTQTTCDEFINFLKQNENPTIKRASQHIVSYEIVKKKSLYGFDGGKYHKFLFIKAKTMSFIHALKSLYYDKEKEQVNSYNFAGTKTYIYESMVPPLLRFFHIQEISPSGWIRLEDYYSVKTKKTKCNFELVSDYEKVISVNKDTPVPYKICSFDIEASSSHGDFPEAIKDYKKVAYDIVYFLEKNVNKEDYPNMLKKLLLNVFSVESNLPIDICYPKQKMTETKVLEGFNKMMALKVSKKKEVENRLNTFFKKEEEKRKFQQGDLPDNNDDETDDDENIEEETNYNSNTKHTFNTLETQADLIAMLTSNNIDTPVKIMYLMDILDSTFPSLEGDQVTFIGSTFVNYGDEKPTLQHCICVNSTNKITPEHTLESYKTEREALLAWRDLIEREDPDIIIGYNIFGFDYEFMYDRACENGGDCVTKFMNLGRNNEYKTELEESTIILASGPYEFKKIPMSGRLQIDLLVYMRKEFNLTSYKLDYVAGYLLSDNVKKYENNYEGNNNQCRVWTKNMKGLEENSFIHFEVINHSTDLYQNGKKFKVIQLEKDGFVIEGNLDCKDKMTWGLAKDDVSPQQIFEMTKQGPDERGIIAKYCIQDCNLVHHIFQKVDVLTTFIEMSKLCSVPINFLVMRGQGIKLTSYVAKKCREKDVLMPFISKGNPRDAYEGAIVLDPKCNLYLEDPVACVDYSSLYPSSIISENLSHDSKVWTKEFNMDGSLKTYSNGEPIVWGYRDEKGNFIYDNLPEYSYVDVRYDTYIYKHVPGKKKMVKTLNGYKVCRYAQYPNDQKAILPSILQELLAARKSTKKQMEKETDPFQQNILDKRQLSIKVTANSLYGQCGAKTSSFYEMDVAASTTATGRKLLIYGKEIIENVYGDADVETKYGPMHTKAEYVYGDTDSVFFTFNLTQDGVKVPPQKALEVTIDLAQDAGHLATMFLKKPHDLEYEKTFLPFCLLSKKRYVGMLYELDPNQCKRKSMGIVLKRRDNAPIVKDVYGGIIDILMKDRDVKKSTEFLKKCLLDITEQKVPIEKLVISKSLRSFYKKPEQIAHNVLAERIGIRDPGNKPSPGDRIPYVYIQTTGKKLQGEKIETPTFIQDNNLKIDYGFYITNQIMKPVVQIYTLVINQLLTKPLATKLKQELATFKNNLEYDKYLKKEITIKENYIEKLLFEDTLRIEKNKKAGNVPITSFFGSKK